MKRLSPERLIGPDPADLEVPAVPPPRSSALLELWFKLARRPWRTLALVPADAGCSAGAAARGLAEVGRPLRDGPVLALVHEQLDYASAAALADEVRGFGATPERGCAIVAVPPLVVEPLGTAAVQAADAVILCVTMGQATLASARRTIALVGSERIAGCVVLR